ncbi:unnamed protein product [Closterium sp. NIES-53]
MGRATVLIPFSPISSPFPVRECRPFSAASAVPVPNGGVSPVPSPFPIPIPSAVTSPSPSAVESPVGSPVLSSSRSVVHDLAAIAAASPTCSISRGTTMFSPARTIYF